jgi:Alpha 1,4-glycosyltransferase conserved region
MMTAAGALRARGGMTDRCDLHSLWIGPEFGWLEQLCVASWLGHGHRVMLWTYQPVQGVPKGAEVRDAREILPASAITRHRASGSVSLFSNRFRYHLFQQHHATWLDADVLLLRPFTIESPYVFGWETPDSIGTAVLRLPSGSPTLRDLIAHADSRVPVPPWWPLKERIRQRLRGLVDRHIRGEDMDWGTFGPRALIETLRRYGLAGQALPSDVFYPILYDETAQLYEPPHIMNARITDRTIAVHLWSTGSSMSTPEVVEKRRAPIPAATWIGEKCAAYGIDQVLV